MLCRVRPLTLATILVATPLVGGGALLAQEEASADLLALDSLLNLTVSTSAKYEQKASDAAASITIVTSEDIVRYGYRTLEDMLRNVAGFYVSNDRNYSYLGARGFSRPTDYNNRVLLLLDGHALNDNAFGSASIGTTFALDLDIVDRVEIVRGPGSSLYGTGAMFGVINVVTKTAERADGLEVSGEAGSHGTWHGSLLYGGTLSQDLDLVLSGNWTDSDGPDIYFPQYDDATTNNGIASGVDWGRAYGGHVSMRYKDLTVSAAHSWREKGIPTAAWETNFNDPAAQTLDWWTFVDVKYRHQFGAKTRLSLRASTDRYDYDGAYPYEEIFFDRQRGNWIGGEAQLQWDPAAGHRIIFGFETARNLRSTYRSWDVDATYFDGELPFGSYSFYVQDEFQITNGIAVTAGLRRDQYTTVGGATTPRAALVVHPFPSGTAKFLYGEAFRAPSGWELGYHEPPSGYLGSPDLDPEKIRTVELAWEQRLAPGLVGHVSGFYYRMRGLIDYEDVTTPDSLIAFGPTMLQYQNFARVEALGFESQLQAALPGGQTAYANYSFQRARDLEASALGLPARLSNSPSHLVKAGFGTPVHRYVQVGANFLYESPRNTLQDTKTDDYFLADVTLSTRPLVRHLLFSVSVNNLLDTDYRLPAGFEHVQDAIAQPGRRVVIELRYRM